MASKGFHSGYSKSVTLSACTQENSEPTMFPQTTPDEHPATPPPCRWPAFITLPILSKFQLVWRRHCDVVLFRSCCLFEYTSVQLIEYQLVVNISCIQTFCDHLNAHYIFDQTYMYLKPGLSATARILPCCSERPVASVSSMSEMSEI